MWFAVREASTITCLSILFEADEVWIKICIKLLAFRFKKMYDNRK